MEVATGGKQRQKVVVDPNKLFAGITEIKKAVDQLAERKAQLEARQPEVEARKASEALL